MDRLGSLIDQTPIEVKIAERYPLDRAAQAQESLRSHHVGKVVLRVHGTSAGA